MSQISDFANLSIGLSATPPSQASFGVGMLMVDSADVPVDKRYIIVDKSSYASDLTAGSEALSWCTSLWGQTQNPAQAYIGRWVSAATSYYRVFKDANSTVADWVTVAAAGKFNIDNGSLDEDISPDFTGDTTMDEVAASITTALVASTNFKLYVCSVDVLDRLIITGITPGATSPSFVLDAGATGTDLTGTGFLGNATSFVQAGLDIETIGAAANAVLALDNTPFFLCERGGSTAQQVAFATATNALNKLTLLVVNDVLAKDSTDTTDAGYQINALGYNKVHVEYTEWTTQNPDAAIVGEIAPQTEATINFALHALTGLSESGKGADLTTVVPITSGEATALKAKGYDYLVKPSTITHFVDGLASGGNEMRIMFGKIFCEAKINEEVYGYLVANKVVTFSDSDILAIKGIVEYWLAIMVERKVLEAGYVVEMPLASSFTAATKATHVLDLDDITEAETQRAVNKVNISLSWSV